MGTINILDNSSVNEKLTSNQIVEPQVPVTELTNQEEVIVEKAEVVTKLNSFYTTITNFLRNKD